MRVIGLTGSIACGKSTVSNWLKKQPDIRVIDGDLLSKELTAPGGEALPVIREAFGDGVFTADGKLARRRLSSLVFSDEQARQRLDRLMAPLLSRLTHERLAEAEKDGILLCFLDYPLLFEKGYDSLCDTVWCVYLPLQIQLERLMARDGLSREEALDRMNAVLSSDEKAARSQVIINNAGFWSETEAQLPSLLGRERNAVLRSVSHAPKDAVTPAAVQDVSPVQKNDLSVDPPGIMERPSAARKGIPRRKIVWRLPRPLTVALCATAVIVLCIFTADCLMQAYLKKQADLHESEYRAILNEYPLECEELIRKYASEYNLEPAFVTAIIRNESSFQPRAESSVGARGLMQLMPDTAEWIAHKLKINSWSFDRMWDPESNIRFGCWYLNYLSSLFRGDPVCISCAYHAGQGEITSWLSDRRYSDDGITLPLDRLPDGPTKQYAGRVTKAYGIYKTLYFTDSSPADSPLSRPD